MASIKLSTINLYSEIRVNTFYIVAGIDASELLYCLFGDTQTPLPLKFDVEGKDVVAHMELRQTDIGADLDVESWRYVSTNWLKTKDGFRPFSLTVYND